MEQKSLELYLQQSLNLGLATSLQGESTYTNAFAIEVKDGGFEWIPRFPAGFIINFYLYKKIFEITSAALHPKYTLLPQTNTFFVAKDTSDIHIQRALYFPWIKGVSKRLMIPDLDDFTINITKDKIPIMDNLTINFDEITSVGIAGNSGSGKSYFLTYLLTIMNTFSDLIVIDPKYDAPSRWVKVNKVEIIHPISTSSKSDFVSSVCESLSSCLEEIFLRQNLLFNNPKHDFKHITIVIDEVLALSEGVSKAVNDSFFSLLSQVALLGRATKIHLVLVSGLIIRLFLYQLERNLIS